MAQPFLHPALDGGLRSGPGTIGGGTLRCRCPSERVEVTIAGDVAHNHACGCSQCWKPEGALFSVVGVVPADDLKVTAHEEKLDVVDPSATIRRHACRQCGVHMYGRIVKDHAFRGLDFVHVELSDDEGWQPPQFAGFVSSIIEQGYRPEGMEAVRARFKALGLPTYDCLSPPLMDAIAGFAAKQALRMSSKSIPAEAAAAPRLDSSRTASASIPGGPARPPAGDAAMKKPSGVKGFLAKLFGG